MSTIKISKAQWEFVGKKAGWIKTAAIGTSPHNTKYIKCPKCSHVTSNKGNHTWGDNENPKCGHCGEQLNIKNTQNLKL